MTKTIQAKKIFKVFLLLGFCFVLGFVFYKFFNPFNLFCDALAYNYTRIYTGKGDSLLYDFTQLANQNTEIIKSCQATSFTETPQSDLGRELKDRSVKKYTVKYSCDILDFTDEIYKKENNYYQRSLGMGACGSENVNFLEKAYSQPIGGQIYTQYWFEYYLIQDNLNKFDFCVEVNGRENGFDQYTEDFCTEIQAGLTKSHKEAAEICNKVSWIPSKIDCYQNKVFVGVDSTQKAVYCNQLKAEIPQNNPYRIKLDDLCK